ncbi:MAG: metallophosphoesterase family protein [Aeromicrobium sp.]
MASRSQRSAHARRRRRRHLRKRIAIAAGTLLVIAALAALIIQPPAFLRSASDGPTSPAASPSTTSPPAPSPVSTPTLGSVTDVDETLKAHIAMSGDTGTRTASQDRVARRMATEAEKEPYDAFIIAGDLIYPNGDSALTQRSVIDPYKPVLEDATLVPALGNHDVESGEGMDILKRLGRDSAWYVEKIGPVRIIVLDSNRVGNAEQMAWLRKVLGEEQPADTWTMVVMHHAPYSAGEHGSDQNVQRAWVPLFEQADVPLVLTGHDHDYQRSKVLDGITYIVSGGGAKLREAGRRDFTAVSASVLHYTDLQVYEDRIEGRAITHDGKTLDEFTIER